MKAGDIRVGNIFQSERNPHIVIEAILKGNRVLATSGQYYTLDYIKPISLTPEILEKCGFEKDSEVIFKHDDTMVYSGSGFIDYYHFGHPIKKNINYLHQLQNLYYALTGTELEIKL